MAGQILITSMLSLVFGAWLVATILRNSPLRCVPASVQGLLSHPVLSSSIPIWTFFAPNPGIHNFHLLYRDWSGEVFGDWHEVSFERKRKWLCAIWNPQKTLQKALADIVNELTVVIQTTAPERRFSIQLSMPYLTLLSYISALPHPAQATASQFLILRGSPEGFEVYYLSRAHRL